MLDLIDDLPAWLVLGGAAAVACLVFLTLAVLEQGRRVRVAKQDA